MLEIIETKIVCDYCQQNVTEIKDDFKNLKIVPYEGSIFSLTYFDFCEECYKKISEASVIIAKSIENIHSNRIILKQKTNECLNRPTK